MLKVAITRYFTTSVSNFKKIQASNLKGKKKSSQEWIQRQLSDPYVQNASLLNYRCRSAFKLLEIDDRYKILANGQVIIDCGAAPGSWSQVAISRAGPTSTIIAIDRLQFYPIEGVHILGNTDFTKSHDKIKELLGENKVNLVLSDMAPNATGIKAIDAENIINLAYSVLKFAVTMSDLNATVLIKIWQCADAKKLENDMLKFYENVKFVKPNASRNDSSEIYLLGRQFKGLNSN